MLMWSANFNAQLASALAIEGDYDGAVSALAVGAEAAERVGMVELRMFFAAAALHVRMLCWEDSAAVEAAARQCEEIWGLISSEKVNFFLVLVSNLKLFFSFYVVTSSRRIMG